MKPEQKNLTKNYYALVAKNRELSGEAATFFAEYKATIITELFPHLHNKSIKILDFGCGDGLMTSFVGALLPQATVYGIDPSAEHIEIATIAYPTISFSVSGHILKFSNATFNLIYAAETFHHIPPQEHEHYLQELMRILKPGGALIVFELNPYNPATAYTFRRNPHEKDAHMMRPRSTKQLMSKYGPTQSLFYSFFPQCMRLLRPLEKYMRWIPLGSVYVCMIRANRQDPT